MNQELLTNFPVILEFIRIGNSYKEIAQLLNTNFNIDTNDVVIKKLIYSIKNNTINKRYNNLVVIDGIKSAQDKLLDNYAVDFHGLLVTYKIAVSEMLYPEFIITRKNLTSIWDKEALLYAKRLIKHYQLSDIDLLKQHAQHNPQAIEIDYPTIINHINQNLDNEISTLLTNLRIKFNNYTISKLKGVHHHVK